MFSGCLLFIASFVNATVRTVSNSPASIAQFNTIQAAIDASSNGDTVYVQGSPVSYAGFTISNKQLVVIGPGWSPDKNLPHLATINAQISLTGAGTSGTEIQGLTISGGIRIASAGINNIRIIRNHFINLTFHILTGGASTFSGYLFEGNWFTQSGINVEPSSTYQNFIIQNNIFHMNDCCSANSMTDGFVNSVNVLFNHNLFYGITGANNVFGSSCRFLLLTNNIFVRRNANAVNSTFTNNITFNTTNNSPWTINGNIDGGGNITNQDPQIVDQVVINSGTDNALLDFTIAAGPANNSGTDGKDMGLLYDVTGSLNWTNSRNSRLPRITKMNIVNSTVAVGGSISISLEAKTSN